MLFWGLLVFIVDIIVLATNINVVMMNRIPKNIYRYEAEVINYYKDSKNKNLLTKVYRCKDDSGRVMIFSGINKISATKQEYQELMDAIQDHDFTKEVIWANEDWSPEAYQDKDNAPYVDWSDVKAKIIVNIIFAVISAAVIGFTIII